MPKKQPTKKKPAKPRFPWIDEKLRSLAVPIEELEHDPNNARKHDEANLKAIAASLKKYGQVQALVVNSKNRQVVIGNGRLSAARQLGWTHLAAIARAMTPAQQRALAIADNRTSELAEWDQATLDAQLALLETEEPELFDDLLLVDLMSEPGEEEAGGPAGAEIVPETYEVVVTCSGESDQKAFYERITTEGRKCRLLTL